MLGVQLWFQLHCTQVATTHLRADDDDGSPSISHL